MNQPIKVSVTDPLIRKLLQVTFPQYRGRKIKIVPQTYPLNCKSYWDGGSRDYFAFVRLDTFQSAAMPAQSAYDRDIKGADSIMLPAGVACVEHSIFCGKDVGITIHVNPSNLVSLLPADHPTLLSPVPAKPRYEVIESKVWINKVNGRRVSIYGALPWISDSEREQWEIVTQGWTIRDIRENTIGCGRVPWKTQIEAQADADKWNSPCTCDANEDSVITCARHSEVANVR